MKLFCKSLIGILDWSPSTRRAWIEITLCASAFAPASPSPSTRRAWIEIGHFDKIDIADGVALHTEGVD